MLNVNEKSFKNEKKTRCINKINVAFIFSIYNIIKLHRHLYIIRLISLKRTIYHLVRKIGLLCKIISIRHEPFRFLNRKNCTSDTVQTGKNSFDRRQRCSRLLRITNLRFDSIYTDEERTENNLKLVILFFFSNFYVHKW